VKLALQIEKINLWVAVITSDFNNIINLLESFNKHNIAQLKILESLQFLIYVNDKDVEQYQILKTKYNANLLTYRDVNLKTFKKLSIAEARFILNRQLYTSTHSTFNAFSWVADDDLIIDNRFGHYLQWLPKFKQEGVDAIISPCDGEPANCFYSGIRCQIFDYFENYKWLKNLNSNSLLPDKRQKNALFRKRFPEYYYDLTTFHYEHLELPYWIEPVTDVETVYQALKRLNNQGLKLLEGRSPFRKVTYDIYDNPLENAKPAINKGGNAFILSPRMLLTPNTTPELFGKKIRRSDMVWSIINTTYYGYKIISTHFPVIHCGSNQGQILYSKMVDELTSTCVIHTLKEHLHTKNDWKNALSNLSEIESTYKLKLKNRLNCFSNNFTAIKKIIQQMQHFEDLKTFSRCFEEQYSQTLHNIITATNESFDGLNLKSFFEEINKQLINDPKNQ